MLEFVAVVLAGSSELGARSFPGFAWRFEHRARAQKLGPDFWLDRTICGISWVVGTLGAECKTNLLVIGAPLAMAPHLRSTGFIEWSNCDVQSRQISFVVRENTLRASADIVFADDGLFSECSL